MNRPNPGDYFRPILVAVVILSIIILLVLSIYSLNIDVTVKGSLIGVVIGGGLTFLGQMWSQDVNNTHELRMAKINYENQLRIAALDKRLQAHQEAYTLWLKLYRSVKSDRIMYSDTKEDWERLNEIVSESYSWSDANSLYLSQEAAEAFYRAIGTASRQKAYGQYPDLSQMNEHENEIYKRREAEWKELSSAGTIIASGIGLPSPNLQEFSKDKKSL